MDRGGRWRRWDDRMHGWGRWGPEDELGTLNLFGIAGRPDPVHYLIRDGGDYAAGPVAPVAVR
jgi:hypothetical protein